MDLHHNVYYCYRGSNTDNADRDRQLENNLTKALINSLALGGEEVWGPFLADLGLGRPPRVEFLLQRCTLPSGCASKRKRRVLLGISKRNSAWSRSEERIAPYETLPDAWIYGDGFAVLVESKVHESDFSCEQMQSHLTRLEAVDSAPCHVVLRTWEQLHTLFRDLLPSLKRESSRLLVSQFIQFLEYSGMTGFTGFRREHFDYFLLHDDEDARRWVREQVGDLACQVLNSLHAIADFYQDYDVGELKSAHSYCWVAFGPRKRAYRAVTHQTLSIAADGIRVFINTETKPAADRLKNVLGRSPEVVQVALRNLHRHSPFELILEERTNRQVMLFDYTPKMRLHSSMLVNKQTRDVGWEALLHTIKLIPLPYLRIERLEPTANLLQLSNRDSGPAVNRIVEILKRNHEIVELLNSA